MESYPNSEHSCPYLPDGPADDKQNSEEGEQQKTGCHHLSTRERERKGAFACEKLKTFSNAAVLYGPVESSLSKKDPKLGKFISRIGSV
ncbi:hypothetical protein OUZ56_004335 [Daphnia magna]|uniref:Uncharacterized protein n=1 Tax=Daphnia magna TaxID=35525 RepID=A0ABQ9YPI3_9CRUS|nr:hypothetical protein OUZ56_004335 [Daphnia magna]